MAGSRSNSRGTPGVIGVIGALCASVLLAACGSGSSGTGSGGSSSPATGGSSSPATSAASAAGSDNPYNTITPGVLKVSIEPYMPYTDLKNGQLIGLDSDIIAAAAKKLNLKVETEVTDFTGMLAGVQSRRVDITVGGIAWTKERQKQGLFTDPPYYSPPAMAVHGSGTYTTVDSLQGHNLGTVTGYVWVKSIKSVPKATLHSYPDANGAFSDLGSGRIDVAFLDPLLISYTQKQRPDLGFTTQYLTPPTDAQLAAHPDYQYFRPYMTGFYVPKEEAALEKAVSEAIDGMYADGSLAALVTKWGGDPKQYLTPSPWMAAERQGVDRPADWKAPSVG